MKTILYFAAVGLVAIWFILSGAIVLGCSKPSQDTPTLDQDRLFQGMAELNRVSTPEGKKEEIRVCIAQRFNDANDVGRQAFCNGVAKELAGAYLNDHPELKKGW